MKGHLWWKEPMAVDAAFFLSYRWELAVLEPLLYSVFKINWDKLDPQNWKKKNKDTPDLLL